MYHVYHSTQLPHTFTGQGTSPGTIASTTVPFAPVTGTCFNPGFQFRLCRQGKIVTQHCASESSSKRKKNAQRGMTVSRWHLLDLGHA